MYDAVALEQRAEEPYAAGAMTATAEATVFFRQRKDELNEVVRACVEAHGGGALPAQVELTVGGRTETQPLHFGGGGVR